MCEAPFSCACVCALPIPLFLLCLFLLFYRGEWGDFFSSCSIASLLQLYHHSRKPYGKNASFLNQMLKMHVIDVINGSFFNHESQELIKGGAKLLITRCSIANLLYTVRYFLVLLRCPKSCRTTIRKITVREWTNSRAVIFEITQRDF